MQRHRVLTLELAALLFVGFLWGAQFGFNKILLETIPPFTGVALRLIIAAAFLWAVVAIRRDPIPRGPRMWRDFSIQAILTAAGPGLMIVWSQQYIDSALAAILNSTTPIFAALITIFVTRHETVGVRKLIGIAVGLGGVITVIVIVVTIVTRLAGHIGAMVVGTDITATAAMKPSQR